MRIKSVFSHSFEKYGKVLTGYDVTDLLKKLDDTTKNVLGTESMVVLQ